jgi:cytochrome c-type biogenesis protein CcmH
VSTAKIVNEIFAFTSFPRINLFNHIGVAMKKALCILISVVSFVAFSARATPVQDPAAVSGKVSLSKAMAGKAAPTDTVFILARAAQGPRMPLAVFRKQVKDLPIEFTLDDSMAMQPQMKLSGFDQVIVVARISKSGGAMSQPGDFEGVSAAIKPGTKDLNIVIDSIVK